MRNILPALLLSLSVLTVSCGDSDSDDNTAGLVEGSLDGSSYLVTDGAALVRNETEMSGTGTALFKSPLGEIGSKDNFLLNFRLEEGGRLDLLTHTDNAGKSGVSAIFTRQGAVVSVAWSANGTTSETKVLEGIDASGDISLAIDIHNDETPSHNLIWNGTSSSFEESDALVNSEDDIASPGNGVGTFWGLTLSKATVLSASLQVPKFVEE